MNILLDTHMAIWMLQGSANIPAKALRLMLDDENDLYVSDISAWEIAIKHTARPDKIPGSAERFVKACDEAGYLGLSLTRDAVLAYEQLDVAAAKGIHKDPFDRMLIAQSKAANMPLLTHDRSLSLYHEPLVLVV